MTEIQKTLQFSSIDDARSACDSIRLIQSGLYEQFGYESIMEGVRIFAMGTAVYFAGPPDRVEVLISITADAAEIYSKTPTFH
jgi:hypothetical protein